MERLRFLERLVDWLGHGNEVIRYWAAQGILMLAEAGQPAVVTLRDRLDSDPSPHVRVVVAETLARLASEALEAAQAASTWSKGTVSSVPRPRTWKRVRPRLTTTPTKPS